MRVPAALVALLARRARRVTRRRPLAVDVRAALALVGTLVKYLSVFALPAALGLGYSEPYWPFLAAGAVAAAAGWTRKGLGGADARVGVREAFLVVAVGQCRGGAVTAEGGCACGLLKTLSRRLDR